NGGNLINSNLDSTNLTINKSGSYIVQASVATGCPVSRTDTITVLSDTLKPVATAFIGSNSLGQMQLFGGDLTASNYSTPFGGSKGLSWNWTGPLSFISNLQNPIINSWGLYNLTVTEERNGCTNTASVYANFGLLLSNSISLSCSWSDNMVLLKWKNTNGDDVAAYEIERSNPGNGFIKIGNIPEPGVIPVAGKLFSFADKHPAANTTNSYRIKAVTKSGKITYSNVGTFTTTSERQKNMYFRRSN